MGLNKNKTHCKRKILSIFIGNSYEQLFVIHRVRQYTINFRINQSVNYYSCYFVNKINQQMYHAQYSLKLTQNYKKPFTNDLMPMCTMDTRICNK